MNKTILAGLCALLVAAGAAHAQSTAFGYQGRLNTTNGPATGLYDFSFNLYATSNGGPVLTASNAVVAVPVTNGLFAVTLDFGNQFSGADRWLEIAVRTNGSGNFVTLAPRQPLTPTPYAIRAASAGTAITATTATTANNVATGAVNGTALAGNAVDSSKIADGSIAASDLSFALLSNTFWRLTGNAGTSPGVNFIGTTDGQALRIQAPRVGINTATPRGPLEVNTGAGSIIFRNEDNVAPGITVSNSPNEGVLRFRHRLEVWPNPSATEFGTLDVRDTNGAVTVWLPARGNGYFLNGPIGIGTNNPQDTLHVGGPFLRVTGAGGEGAYLGGNGFANDVQLGSVNPAVTEVALFNRANSTYMDLIARRIQADQITVSNGTGVSIHGPLRLNDSNLWLRVGANSDHGLGWYGGVKTFGGFAPDGPALFGFAGGVLGTTQGGQTNVLTWNSAGRVGIGTSSPGSSLEVNGGIRARGGAPGGGGGLNNGYAFDGTTGDDDSGMFSSADGQVEFYANAIERMRITGNGNVGIGTTTPQAKVDVIGTVRATSFEGAGAGLTGLNAANITVGTLPQGQLPANIARLNSVQTFTSDNSFIGKVGIGTASPVLPLEVFGMSSGVASLRSSSTAGTVLSLSNDTGRAWNLISSGAGDGEGSGKLLVKLSGAFVNSKLALTPNGDLGIGTAYPQAKLEVNGDVRVRNNLIVDGDGANGGNISPGLSFGGTGSGEGISSRRTGGANRYGLDFYTQGFRRLSITNDGAIHIHDNPLYLRNNGDPNHGLAFRSSFGGQPMDGPALFGYANGVLGTTDGGERAALTWNREGDVTVTRNLITCSLTIRGGCDVAEPFPMKEEAVEPGSVVVIDDDHPGQLKLSGQAYDTRVAGIVSGAGGVQPGIALHQEGVLEGGKNVALSGRVYVKADATHGAIRPGDLLTTSERGGHAMKVADHTRSQGAILGKAMSALKDGTGLVLVLVTLQ